jgi:hypothetical protein
MERLTVDSNFPEKNNSQILIYQAEGELMPEATIRKFRIVQKEGKRVMPLKRKK